MKLLSISIRVSIIVLVALLSACSKDKTEQTSAPAQAANTSSNSPTSAPKETQSVQGNIPKSGKVIKAMHAGGYTYMELEESGRVFWIAANMMNVKRNDQVVWADAALMKNFKSPSLRRTFDEILFVSQASVQ